MKKIVNVLLVSILVVGCKKNEPLIFDYGDINNHAYKNTFFNLELPVNPNWFILKGYKKHSEAVKPSEIKLIKLFAAYKNDPGVNSPDLVFNPSVVINVQNINDRPDIKTASDYFKQIKTLLSKTTMKMEFVKEKEKLSIGDEEFGFLQTKNTSGTITIVQDYYVTIKNGFILIIVMAYDNEAHKNELYNMFNQLKIEK